jgi:hypothetical protein
MSEENLEGLFGEPEELPVTAPPPPAPPPEAAPLEGILEEVVRTERRLRELELLRDLLCPERAYYDVFIIDGDLVVVDRFYVDEIRELHARARRFARLALLVHGLRAAGCLPPDVIVVDDPLYPLSLSQIHAAVFGSCIALFRLSLPHVLFYVFELGDERAELVGLFFDEEWKRVEEIEIVVSARAAKRLASAVKAMLSDACLQHHLRSKDLLPALRLARRIARASQT